MIAKILRLTITTPDPIVSLPPLNPSTATIPTLRGLLRRGRVTSAFLVEIYLEQVVRHRFDVFTFDQGELMAQAHICDNMRARGNVVGPLGGIPVLVAVNAATYETMEPDGKGTEAGVGRPPLAGLVVRKAATHQSMMNEWKDIGEGVLERPFLAGLATMKATTHELREPDRKGTEGGLERPIIGGRGLVLGFLDEDMLGEVVKWERLEEGGMVLKTCVVEGLAVVVRDVEDGI